MTTDSQYSWTSFYMEFADKLLAFKDDRAALIVRLKGVYEECEITLPALEPAGMMIDIDPFTVFWLFNCGDTIHERKRVIEVLANRFGLSSSPPKSLAGALSLRNDYLYFRDVAPKSAEARAIRCELLWALFEAALAYADQPTSSSRSKFASAYDFFSRMFWINWDLTVGLYWVRPYAYVGLRPLEAKYIADTVQDEISSLISSPRSVESAEGYLELCGRLLSAMHDGTCAYTSFPQLSACAWQSIGENDQEYKRERNMKKKAVQTAALGDEGVHTARYWLYAPGRGAHMWEEFYRLGIMGLSWPELGDLSGYATMEDMRLRLLELFTAENTSLTNSARAVWEFANEIKPGDIIFVKRGRSEILGRGVVTSEYVYDPDVEHYPHTRTVKWTNNGYWASELKEFPLKTLTDITDNTRKVADIEAFFATDGNEAEIEEPSLDYPLYGKESFLADVFLDANQYDTIVGLLRFKKNLLLQGAPGVGKTFAAKRLAYSMMGVKDASRVMLVQFHQSYSYEDFIEGYRPSGAGFELVKGAFYSFCKKAADDEENDYFFIIDEINRGNLSKIFGELFMLIESDKRGYKLQLLYSRELFSVPANVHIIGMMNTADRSLAMLDYALRRRFAFVELRPAFDSEGFRDYCSGLDNPRFEALVREVESLNRAIAEDESLGEGFCIGHSYFCNMKPETSTDAALASIVDYELIPMLKEYWFDEPGKVRDWTDRLRRSLR